MSETAGISTGIAKRYATAVFDLATESKAIKALESDVAALEAAMTESADLRTLLTSPLYSREEQAAAIGAVAKKMKLSDTTSNVLALLASKRRLFVMPHLIAVLQDMLADARGAVRRSRLARSNQLLTTEAPFAQMTAADRMGVIRDQTMIATLFPDEAIRTLTVLLPDAASRRKALKAVETVAGPEMMSGVRASSMRIESTSSTMAKAWPRWPISSTDIFMLSRR